MSPSGQICLHFSCLSFIWRLWILPFEGPLSFSYLFFLCKQGKQFLLQICIDKVITYDIWHHYRATKLWVKLTCTNLENFYWKYNKYIISNRGILETFTVSYQNMDWGELVMGVETAWFVVEFSICKSLTRPGVPRHVCDLQVKFEISVKIFEVLFSGWRDLIWFLSQWGARFPLKLTMIFHNPRQSGRD